MTDLPNPDYRRVAPRQPKRRMLDPVLVRIIDEDLASAGAGNDGPSESECVNRLLAVALSELYGEQEFQNRAEQAAADLLTEMDPEDLFASEREQLVA